MKRIHPLLAFVFIGLAALFATNQAQAGYVDNGDGTVTDQATGLVWQKAASDYRNSWEPALALCQSATTGGYSDWRLPNIRELLNLVDDSRYYPALDPVFSDPCGGGCEYCSSSTSNLHTEHALGVKFLAGTPIAIEKTGAYYVRCVRGGP